MELANISSKKKWLLGVEGSKSPVEIGYIDKLTDQMHYHEDVHEYYIVVSGNMKMLVERKEVLLKAGTILYIEPKEKHRISGGDKELKCFLIKWPHMPEDKVAC